MFLRDKIAGALVGMTLGDSMGMPGELWSRERIRSTIGFIGDFIDGIPENIVSCYYKAGEYTDDSSQAFVILNTLSQYNTVPDRSILAEALLSWVKSVDGFNKNILGASSKAALTAYSQGEDASKYTILAETNGAAMRIAPIGCLIPWNDPETLVKTVVAVSRVTHASDVTLGSAALIAQAVASAIGNRSFPEIIDDALKAHDLAKKQGSPTHSANCKSRLVMALDLIKNATSDAEVEDILYNIVGTGVLASESVPTALAIASYCQDPERCALFCANLGGDTDTIGAMATAICGAYTGISKINSKHIKKLELVNNISYDDYIEKTLNLRNNFKL